MDRNQARIWMYILSNPSGSRSWSSVWIEIAKDCNRFALSEMLHLRNLTDLLRADEDAIRRGDVPMKKKEDVSPANNQPVNYAAKSSNCT
jgi:hypothetical protein